MYMCARCIPLLRDFGPIIRPLPPPIKKYIELKYLVIKVEIER